MLLILHRGATLLPRSPAMIKPSCKFMAGDYTAFSCILSIEVRCIYLR